MGNTSQGSYKKNQIHGDEKFDSGMDIDQQSEIQVQSIETGFKPIYEARDPQHIEEDELLRKKMAIKNQIENRYGDKKKKMK